MHKRLLLGCSALMLAFFALDRTPASACGGYYGYGYGAGCGCGYGYYARPAFAYYAPSYYAADRGIIYSIAPANDMDWIAEGQCELRVTALPAEPRLFGHSSLRRACYDAC